MTVSESIVSLRQLTRAKKYIGGVSLFECLRVNVVVLDAGEDKIVTNTEPEAPCENPFFVKINARENCFTFYIHSE